MKMPRKLDFTAFARKSLENLAPELSQEALLQLRIIASNLIGDPVLDADIGAYDLPSSARLLTRQVSTHITLHIYFEYIGDATVIIWQIDVTTKI